MKQARESPEALAAKPHPGPAPRLNSDQLKQLEDELRKGAKHHGWKTELWTAARVTALTERLFRITFHVEHVRKILKARLRWTSQKPEKRARERDEEAVRH